MILLIASTLAITYRIVPAILAKAGNLPPGEADLPVRRLCINSILLTAIILATLAAGALPLWLHASVIL